MSSDTSCILSASSKLANICCATCTHQGCNLILIPLRHSHGRTVHTNERVRPGHAAAVHTHTGHNQGNSSLPRTVLCRQQSEGAPATLIVAAIAQSQKRLAGAAAAALPCLEDPAEWKKPHCHYLALQNQSAVVHRKAEDDDRTRL